MKYEKRFVESYLKNSLAEITDVIRPKQTSEHVWGKEICRVYPDKNGVYFSDEKHELENWYIGLNMGANICKRELDELIQQVKSDCQQKELESIPQNDNMGDYTCHRLCDWSWLEDEQGNILKEQKNVRGETVAYQAKLVKYAKVLKDLPQQGDIALCDGTNLEYTEEEDEAEQGCIDCRVQTVREFANALRQEMELFGYDEEDFCVKAISVVEKQMLEE